MQRMHGWVGRKDRQDVEIDAVVHRADGTNAPVKLSNVSDEGCRIDSARDFRIGERVEIAIAEVGPVKAQVRWALPGSAGARFICGSDA
jgi:hypothetical protein